VSGTAGFGPCPASRVRHAHDDGGYYEQLRRGLLGHGTIYAHRGELLVLTLALLYPWLLVTVYSAGGASSPGGIVGHCANKGPILAPRPTTRATLIFGRLEAMGDSARIRYGVMSAS
jgi:hypothetical protein